MGDPGFEDVHFVTDFAGHFAVRESLYYLEAGFDGFCPLLTRDGQRELDAEVVELVSEDVAGGFLEGEGLVRGEVGVEFSQYFEAAVGGLSSDGVIPGVEQDFFAFFLFVDEFLSHCPGLFRIRRGGNEILNGLAGFGPLVVFEEGIDVGDILVDPLLAGRALVVIDFGLQLLGQVLVYGSVGYLAYHLVCGFEILLLEFVEDGFSQGLSFRVVMRDGTCGLADTRVMVDFSNRNAGLLKGVYQFFKSGGILPQDGEEAKSAGGGGNERQEREDGQGEPYRLGNNGLSQRREDIGEDGQQDDTQANDDQHEINKNEWAEVRRGCAPAETHKNPFEYNPLQLTHTHDTVPHKAVSIG